MPTDTKTALLNSAERAARARGFDGFSYADLATDVGIRKASIHHHFPSKANLSVALMRRYAEAFETEILRIDEEKTSGSARLQALIDIYREALENGKSLCLCVSFSSSPESLPPEVIAQIRQFRAMLIGWLTKTFEAGQSDGSIAGVAHPELESAAALAVLEGAQLAARAEEDVVLFDMALKLLKGRLSG
ncbi:MAG: TetR/AcrR family transcriptional regulator [Shimia thalassica]|uniref:TetR/AcrR family transcriptional regulator n=1 Tax=Shimia thalassica TaxID=1715693 RepID=UPI003299ECB4